MNSSHVCCICLCPLSHADLGGRLLQGLLDRFRLLALLRAVLAGSPLRILAYDLGLASRLPKGGLRGQRLHRFDEVWLIVNWYVLLLRVLERLVQLMVCRLDEVLAASHRGFCGLGSALSRAGCLTGIRLAATPRRTLVACAGSRSGSARPSLVLGRASSLLVAACD